MIPLVATYRMQLRNGVTFAEARDLVPEIAELGFSHLYLSPIFTAGAGSSHGYDVTDPTEIDPVLGGETGYVDLVETAHAAGLGIVLDIVPNHTAFSLDNPWLRDVLKHGPQSRFKRHFDIDWSERLVLPWLSDSFESLSSAGRIRVSGETLQAEDLVLPLAPGTESGEVSEVHDRQHWQLTHWVRERDGITHRRFFTVTGLIGMLVEDEAVFEACHAKIFELVDRGLVDALRVDHVDGLADPAAYLDRLSARVKDMPVWVEKILSRDERLADWPVAGTTGYEAARQISRLFTKVEGHDRLLGTWSDDTGQRADFHAAVIEAKHEILLQELAAELHQLIALGRAAADVAGDEHGDEALREAVIGLLVAMPRYRTYFLPGFAREEDRSLLNDAADTASQGLRSRHVVDLLAGFVSDPATAEAAAFQQRFQQVTGALIAKAHEDTAAFRQTAYLAACEVGADPDEATLAPTAFQDWCMARKPEAMTLTSSHDTKRSEDSRMRLVAMSHLPDDFFDLLGHCRALPGADAVRPQEMWYLVQSALGIWNESDPELETRLRDHMIKALREAKSITTWTHPDDAAEAPVLALSDRVCAAWRQKMPEALGRLIRRGEALSLAQVAVKMALPGVPDVYQGTMGRYLALTDPDNRRPVDPDRFQSGPEADGFAGRKFRLARALLDLRRTHRRFFETAQTRVEDRGDGLTLTRVAQGNRLSVRLNWADTTTPVEILWNDKQIEDRPDLADLADTG